MFLLHFGTCEAKASGQAESSVVLRAAASAWADGVPWAEGPDIASRAMAGVDAVPRSLPRGKGRGRGGKGRGRGEKGRGRGGKGRARARL